MRKEQRNRHRMMSVIGYQLQIRILAKNEVLHNGTLPSVPHPREVIPMVQIVMAVHLATNHILRDRKRKMMLTVQAGVTVE